MASQQDWNRYQQYLCQRPEIGLALDISRMAFDGEFFDRMAGPMTDALAAMAELENGAIANPDEDRMVGHYWLRAPELAPSEELADAIRHAISRVKAITDNIQDGVLRPEGGGLFRHLLVIGIGGSALGPQFVSDALGDPKNDRMSVHFIDNTDPDGVARTFDRLDGRLHETLSVVISKSGGTPETRNGMVAAQAAYGAAGLDFAKHAIAITGEGSKLDKTAVNEGWVARLPMWDWVGGRTSETSAVGLLPAALQGLDIDQLLAGAAACDRVTRETHVLNNPAALLALMWYHATDGRGAKDMVVLPYKDRLLLFSRYLQQLVMESLGKEMDLTGQTVHQGIAVYGNKGSTDQHAYVQQLREGVNNFFVTFIEIRDVGDREINGLEVEPGITAGDYLRGFYLGTREALSDNGRESMTITVDRVDAFHVGVLIALYERAVGLYASLIGINAYHQPGVEAGKKAAASVLDLQRRVVAALSDQPQTAEQIARAIDAVERAEWVYLLLDGLAASGRGVSRSSDGDPASVTFTAAGP